VFGLDACVANLGVGLPSATTTIFTDNNQRVHWQFARNPVFYACTKYIEVHYHYVREKLSAGKINFAYVPTEDNLADLFTKALPHYEKFEAFRKALGLLPLGIDHSPYSMAVPYTLSASSCSQHHSQGDLLPCYGSDVCEHT